ncbi:MAG: DHH family phosphoesterase, partial [Clostridia bacterium]|nr:DHH family phosphoesterase [Clostridia bacterium]
MINDIIEKAKVEKKKLFIYTHKMPDIDSIFAAYALKEYLALFGIQSKYVMGTSHKKFRVERNTDTTNSISVILDTVTVGQAESNRFLKSWKNDIYVYDHHGRSSTTNLLIEEELGLPKSNVKRLENVTSTCEVLFRDFNPKKITPRIAYFLLTGILANSGLLRHPK